MTTIALISINEDETYRRTLRQVGPNIDVIVTGHTHLARAIVTATRGVLQHWHMDPSDSFP